VRRRDVFPLISSVAIWPLRARAQQPERMRHIGVLMNISSDNPEAQARNAAFVQGLQELGWIVGRNVRIDYRWGVGDEEYIHTHAAELVALQPDVIFASPASAVPPLHRLTKTIPIIFAQVPDPIALGLVESLARPGGNITGFALYEQTIGVKWIELLKQIAPSVAHVAVIRDPRAPTSAGYLAAIQAAAPSLGVKVLPYEARDARELERAFDEFAPLPNAGLIMPPSGLAVTQRDRIVSLAAKYRLPGVYAYRYYVVRGGLASYGVDETDGYKRAASYVDRILKGEKPADLPVQYATKFELVINMKTAKALGLDIPVTLLARTDELIE
jgi:ABC-type uncharacterized transport system substrate-binding protein